MITSITLQNFKSFGEEQTIPLAPITVLVGPNNSGKSNLVSVGRFVQSAVHESLDAAVEAAGGSGVVLHRPPLRDRDPSARIAWATEDGAYSAAIVRDSSDRRRLVTHGEELTHNERGSAWTQSWVAGQQTMQTGKDAWEAEEPFSGLRKAAEGSLPSLSRFRDIWKPLVDSREVKLSVSALRKDAEVVPAPRLGVDGSNAPAVLGLWRGADPERVEALQGFVRRCLPEIQHVLVKPSPIPHRQRLWVQQADGEQFDADHISDGSRSFASGRYLGNFDHLTSLRAGWRGTTPPA